MNVAVALMFCGAAVSLVVIVVNLAMMDAFRSSLRQQGSMTYEEIETMVDMVIWGAVVTGALGVGLWTWMALACRGGHNWARIASTVFFGIYVLSLLNRLMGGMSTDAPAWAKLIGLVPLVLGGAVMSLLWKEESNPYFRPGS